MTVARVALNDPDLAVTLGRSFERHGFAILARHGIPAETIAAADAAARVFFALPDPAKRRCHRPGTGGARGYTPFGIEAAKDGRAQDLKEFYHIGRVLPARHRYAAAMPPNVWPEDVPGFREAMLALFAAFERVGNRLLAAVAQHLGLEPDFFGGPTHDGNSLLRLLHYPPLPPGAAGERAAPHEDINVLTLLLGAEEAGLEVLAPEGWLPVAPERGELVVNVADMLQRLTGGRLRSTTHRVRNPSADARARARYSMPFFLHFRPDYSIEALPGSPDPQPPITADAFLQQRLREIRLL